MGFTLLKPGKRSAQGRLASVIVSPTGASDSSFMLAHKKPTSPGPRRRTSLASGENTPTLVTSKRRPVEKIWIFWPTDTSPSSTRKSTVTPR
jgi:hypothetical protein